MPAAGDAAASLERKALRIGGFSQGDGHAVYIVSQQEQIKNMFMVVAM
jgi:hypothetical protein